MMNAILMFLFQSIVGLALLWVMGSVLVGMCMSLRTLVTAANLPRNYWSEKEIDQARRSIGYIINDF